MAIKVYTHDVTTTPAIIPFGDRYNAVDATVAIPDGGGNVFIGGPDVDDDENGWLWEAGTKEKVDLTAGDVWARSSTGTVTIKIIVTGV